MMLNGRKFLFLVLGSGLVLIPAATQKSLAQAATQAQPQAQQQGGSSSGQESPDKDVDPRRRQRSDKERYKAQKDLRAELKGTYKTWLSQDVTYIISDEERKAFMSLSNDEERDAFIENFWLRRNPNPDSPENEFREEHYRRIAYANEHFAAGKPGWKTDRGRIYISWGKPDNIDSHPSGGTYERTPEEGGGSTSTFPFETWHYRYLEGVGENIDLEFVDTCQCGDYHYTLDRSEKDALLNVPGAGLTQYEEMNHKDKTDRFKGGGLERLGNGPMGDSESGKEFDRIELGAKLFAPPPVKFKDLEAFVSEHKVLSGPIFPFDVRTDFVKVTESMDTVPITVQMRVRDITFVTKDGVSRGTVNILGKVTTLSHKTVQTFEDTVSVDEPSELLEKVLDNQRVYWKSLPLQPGLYRLDIAIKDVNNPDHVGVYGRGIDVPAFHDEKLGTSSLILADQLHTVSSREIGNGNFILGNTFVRPRVSANPATPVIFHRNQDLNFWMQVYNLGIDDATKSNQAKLTYQVTDAVTGVVLLENTADSKDLGAHSDELTFFKSLPLAGLQPGKYKVTIKVNDAISKQEIAQSAPFVVE
ncbi:GWxTD domain-containing protein [Telmatobacter bradus]|uniref:GWxTD domain-containing protein n=1 Tax=Telmatobacter bradus TaxID=474953 RepID=UPI003B43B2AB